MGGHHWNHRTRPRGVDWMAGHQVNRIPDEIIWWFTCESPLYESTHNVKGHIPEIPVHGGFPNKKTHKRNGVKYCILGYIYMAECPMFARSPHYLDLFL